MLYSDTTLIALVVGVVIPILVGIVTKLNASSGLKAVLNFGLSAAGSLLAVTTQETFEWKPFLINWGLTWAVSIATYYGLYRPT